MFQAINLNLMSMSYCVSKRFEEFVGMINRHLFPPQ